MASAPDLAGGLSQLASIFSGPLLARDHAAYDDVRRVHDGMVDRREEGAPA